ncbi:MAG: hypothetical protein HQ578_05440, partial [Chloroflexi bacterium]|nr:hypothetical protein [Chloroflexota bacterium]
MAQKKVDKRTKPLSTQKARGSVFYKIKHLTDDDLYLFNEGSHFRLYEKLGARLLTVEGVEGTYFSVWAP